MTCLGLAWELGAASGYAAVMRQIALAAVQQGHRCIAIARDLHVSAPLLSDVPGLTLVQAPVATTSRTPPVRIRRLRHARACSFPCKPTPAHAT